MGLLLVGPLHQHVIHICLQSALHLVDFALYIEQHEALFEMARHHEGDLHLVFRHGQRGAAYHYLLLMKRTYEKEIEIPAFEALSERIALARAAIGREKAAKIEAAVAALPPFLTADGQTGGIGFGQKTTGKRYTYEH